MKLRDYQEDVVEALRQGIREGKRRQICVAPTGAGKTVIASHMIQSARSKGKRAIFLAHRKELIDQASDKLDRYGVPHGIIKAKHKRNTPWEDVQVASVQTLVRRDHVEADIVIIDEAHRSSAKTYQKILARFETPPITVGLTATPYRADGSGLGHFYDGLCVSTTALELVEQGHLVEPTVYAASTVDLSGVHIKMGDFNQEELGDAMADIVLRGEIIDNWMEKARGACTVAFAVNIEHSKRLVEQFKKAGISAAHLDGKTPDKEREAILAGLSDRSIQVVSNVGVLTEGYDLPSLECIILARPTQSRNLFKQMLGRIMRPDDDKRFAYVFDHAGCTHMHGFVTDPEEYDLEAEKQKGRMKKAPQSIAHRRVCEGCSAFIPLRAPRCPECGHVDYRPEGPAIAETDEKLTEVKANRATMDEKQIEYTRLTKVCMEKKYVPGWVAHRYREKFGVWPKFMAKSDAFKRYCSEAPQTNGQPEAEPRRRPPIPRNPEPQSLWDF